MKQALSDEQAKITFYKDGEGAVLVEASAGSGKTRVLTERVRYLLTEKKNKYFSVLCLTFTNKAADEMRERLEGIDRLKDRAFVGNFHDFCLQKILRPRRNLIGLQELPHIFENREDLKKILEQTFLENPIFEDDYKGLEPKEQQKRLDQYLDVISQLKRELVSAEGIDIERPDLNEKRRTLYKDYSQRLLNQNAMDYDDILLYAYHILNENPHIAELCRKDYQYILIDEAQDLNYAQYEIIKVICGATHKNVFMVGDPKQAIYGFNGANAKYMQEMFIQDFGAEKFEIVNNYRSSKRVLELAHQIQANKIIGANFFEGIAELYAFENEVEEAEWIITKIKEWQQKGTYAEAGKEEVQERITLKNIAVLARNKYIFSKLIEQLETDEHLKNNFYLRKGVERFEPESTFVRVFDLGLRVLANPADTLHLKQLHFELRKSYTGTMRTIETLFEIDSSDVMDTQHLKKIQGYWQKLRRNPSGLGWVLNELENKNFLVGMYENIEDIQKIHFDIVELQKYWQAFIRQEPYERQDINNFRYFLALNSTKENKEELILSTVHASKGLEFEIVFLMGMNQGSFPDFRAIQKGTKALQEEQNNAYVAITRAKRCIYLTYPKNKTMPWGSEKPQSKSMFLKDVHEEQTLMV